MKTNLYITCATDREQLELLEVLDSRGYRFPDGKALPVENLPRRGGTADRLPWALDTKNREAAYASAGTVGYLCRLRGMTPVPFSRLDRKAV